MMGESLMLNRLKSEPGSGRSSVTGSWFVLTDSSGARRRIVLNDSTLSFSERYECGPCCSRTRNFGSDLGSMSCHGRVGDVARMLLLTEDKDLSLPIKDRSSNAERISMMILITGTGKLSGIWAADQVGSVCGQNILWI